MDCKIEQSKYGVPMPWIGLYITAASVACLIAMLGDFIWGIRYRRLWFPCLNNPMPKAREQLAKLSGTAFLCITMANFTTSLANMKDSDVILNVVPLVILVITIVVNVSIQMGTGVIHAFLPEHIITMFFLLILMMLTCNAALAITVFKPFVGGVYQKVHQSLLRESLSRGADRSQSLWTRLKSVADFKKDVKRYWMAVMCLDPQYNLYRSERGIATDILSILETGVLIQALVRTLKQGSVIHICTSEEDSSSDYRWSIEFILFFQVVAVGVGVLGPLYRILQRDHVNVNMNFKQYFQSSDGDTFIGRLKKLLMRITYTLRKFDKNVDVDPRNIMTRVVVHQFTGLVRGFRDRKHLKLPTLMVCDFDPLSTDMIQSRPCRRLLHCSKNVIRRILAYLIWAGSALSHLLSQLMWVLWLPSRPLSLARIILFPFTKVSLVTEFGNSFSEEELRNFLGGTKRRGLKITDGLLLFRLVNANRWIQDESKKSVVCLTNLVKVSSASGRAGPLVHLGPLAHRLDPPKLLDESSVEECWALRVVNLTSIAVLMPCAETTSPTKSELVCGVGEGLKFLRFLDKHSKQPVNIRKAANAVWEYVELSHRWFDADVSKFNSMRNNPMAIIEDLEKMGKSYEESDDLSTQLGNMEKSPMAVAGTSMSAICRAIRDERIINPFLNADEAYKWLHSIICNVLAAGLMDLRRALHSEYYYNVFEGKEEHVEEVAYLLSMAENIVEVLEKECHHDDAIVNEWIDYALASPGHLHCKFGDYW